VRFVAFNQQNTLELKDVQVEHLSVDENGRLWVVMGNESVTAFQNGSFQLHRWPRMEPRLRADHVLCLGSNEVLFAGELSYLARLNLVAGTNKWELLTPPAGIEPEPGTFVLGRKDEIWFVTRSQRLARFFKGKFEMPGEALALPELTVVALQNERKDRAKMQSGADSLAHPGTWVATPHHLVFGDERGFVDRTPTNGVTPNRILQIALGGDGGIWVLEKNRLRKCRDGQWVAGTNPAEFKPDTAPGTFSLHGDAHGDAWLIIYGHGLWHVKSDGSARLLTEESGLPSVFITCWFQDDEGDVWIGTAGGGIARIRESHFRALGQAKGLPGKVVRSVCVDSTGELWAGTMSGGLAGWRGSKFRTVLLPTPDASPTESVTVFPESGGGLWIGTLNHGLMRMRGNEITRATAPWETIRVLFGDSHGKLWVGGLVGLLTLQNEVFTQYGSAQGFVDSHAIGALAQDARGAIWIGTGPGELWKFYEGKFMRFTPPVDWPSVRLSAVLPDTNGVIWAGTLGGGLLRFRNGQFTRCRKLTGLPDDNISQLLDSGDGHLWAGTYAGIFRAAKEDLETVALGRSPWAPCRVYGRYDGLPALECSSGFQPSCWRSVDGELLFSTANGVVTVDPRAITEKAALPRVIIEEMLVDGKPRSLSGSEARSLLRPLSAEGSRDKAKKRQEIEPGRHYVQFQFTGLSFAAPDGVRFRVKLEGVDQDWQATGGQRLIGYGPLLPGDYQFRVVACNSEGAWNEQGDTLDFVLLPYFWETWWFKAGLGFVTLTALGFAVALAQRQRYRRKLEHVERQREIERERTRIAQDLHDDLGTSLTQIGMLSALANRDQTPANEAKELIQQVRGCAREMVTALDEIVWAVNPKNDSLIELVNYLGHFAEQFYLPTGIRCRLDIPAQLPARTLSAESRHHLFLAFKEALNNVARHSGATQVRVRFEAQANELVLYVEDDGRGFATARNLESRPGNGLTNMKRRMEQIGGCTEIRSIPGRGTTVEFHLNSKA
jgi:signal transduction histidine kinase/ligand-binding sensor domain-containing protein